MGPIARRVHLDLELVGGNGQLIGPADQFPALDGEILQECGVACLA
jgi:hypothetical protein